MVLEYKVRRLKKKREETSRNINSKENYITYSENIPNRQENMERFSLKTEHTHLLLLLPEIHLKL